MSYFLWIEDFDNSPKITTTEIFNNIVADELLSDDKRELRNNLEKQGIYIELNFQNGLKFIKENLNKIDYIILDINLPACRRIEEVSDSVLDILHEWHNYKDSDEEKQNFALTELQSIAGYYLYTELVFKQGFPQKNILFCSNNGDTPALTSTQKAFKNAKIKHPKIYTKSDSDIQKWVKDNYDNEYSRLRRGIIEACQQIKTLIEQDTSNIQFHEFQKNITAENIKNDMLDYLEILQTIFPLREPKEKETPHLYKLFTRTLAHEWDEKIDKKTLNEFKKNDLLKHTFSAIMCNVRNWSTHTDMFNDLKSQQVAFLFMIAMRSMFKLENETQTYENILLKLYTDKITEIKQDELELKLSKTYSDILNNYSDVLKKSKQKQANLKRVDFLGILQDMQYHDENNNPNYKYLKGLYYLFWHGFSPIKLAEPTESINPAHNFSIDSENHKISYEFNYELKSDLEYKLKLHDYGKPDNSFLFDLARAIYTESFGSFASGVVYKNI